MANPIESIISFADGVSDTIQVVFRSIQVFFMNVQIFSLNVVFIFVFLLFFLILFAMIAVPVKFVPYVEKAIFSIKRLISRFKKF